MAKTPEEEFKEAPKAPKTSPLPGIIPEAPPPGQTRDKEAGLQPIDGSSAPLGGTRERAEAEREAGLPVADQ